MFFMLFLVGAPLFTAYANDTKMKPRDYIFWMSVFVVLAFIFD